jgi:hypothetical protein
MLKQLSMELSQIKQGLLAAMERWLLLWPTGQNIYSENQTTEQME